MERKLSILVILLLCLSVCLSACVHTNGDKRESNGAVRPEKLGFEGGNLNAGGLMCGDGNGWVYYRSESDYWCLYKAKFDGSGKIKLSDGCPQNIDVLDGWVYYSNFRDGFSIYRVLVNGKEETKLVDGYCSNLYVAESGLYFDMRDEHNSAQIYHANLDGSEMKLIIPDMKLCYYYDGIVYCSNTQKMCAYDLETGTLSVICEEYTYNVSVNDSGIYFWDVNNDCFCRIDGDGSTEVIVSGGDFYNLTGSKLYYTGYRGVSSKSPCIYCVDVETKESERVLSLSDQYFDIDGNLLGLTVDMQITEIVDESLFDDEGQFIGYSENCSYTYAIEDLAFARGSLRKSIFETSKLDCLILLDGGDGVVWD